jgi:alkylation response protein AidB-like acyl-CoA dehydrogenase
MLIPAEYEGGSVTEQPLVDLIVLAEELGRELNPGPFLPCNVVADAITRSGTDVQKKEHLARLARGESTCAWCLSGDGSPEPSAVEVRATRVGEGWQLDGVARYVHAAGDATLLLVTANNTDVDGVVNLLVPRPTAGLSERVLSGLDLTRRFAEVRFDGVSVPATAELAGGWSVVERCLSVATVLQSAESVGAADLVFDSTVDYAKKRVQFGRTIGSFQAIKHRLADLLMDLEGMRAAAHYAALALGDGLPDAAEAVATAGAYVDDTFAHLCGEALQLHGGIGFTWEHDIHLFVRRAKVNQVLYGDGAWHRERLVRLVEGDQKQAWEA